MTPQKSSLPKSTWVDSLDKASTQWVDSSQVALIKWENKPQVALISLFVPSLKRR